MNPRIPTDKRVCSTCGDRQSREYYHSKKNTENVLCRKHYQNEYYELSYGNKKKTAALAYYHSHKHEEQCQKTRKEYRDIHRGELLIYWNIKYIANRDNIRKERYLNRLLLIDLLSFGRFSCSYCAYDMDIRALEIDHKASDGGIDRNHRFPNSHSMISYYLSHIDEAMDRLQVLCSNCNRIKRFEMNEWGD